MGRLTDVWEITNDPTAHVSVSFGTQSLTGYLTHYDYNSLDDLTTVTQRKGEGVEATVQTRSFFYDSLRRLKSASNPESGTINYEYDENGNIKRKLDPRLLPFQFSPAANSNRTWHTE